MIPGNHGGHGSVSIGRDLVSKSDEARELHQKQHYFGYRNAAGAASRAGGREACHGQILTFRSASRSAVASSVPTVIGRMAGRSIAAKASQCGTWQISTSADSSQ